jgi:hypothetical protein
MSAWWTGIAPTEIAVTCGDARHRVRWERGRLTVCDHGDVDDERALAALGGAPLQCVELARAWERHRNDLRALVIGPRGGSDELRVDRDDPSSGSALARRRRRRGGGSASVTLVGTHSVGTAATSRFGGGPDAERDDVAELIALATLGGGFGERLVATVAAAWAQRLHEGGPELDEALPRLRAALYGRVLAALRGWLGDPGLSLELRMADPDGPRTVARRDQVVHATLPFAWLVEVWARDLETVHGRFCLSAKSSNGDGDAWQLATIAPDLSTTGRIELRVTG